jgi:hypothetical protein
MSIIWLKNIFRNKKDHLNLNIPYNLTDASTIYKAVDRNKIFVGIIIFIRSFWMWKGHL